MRTTSGQTLQLILSSKKDVVFPYVLMNLIDDHNVDFDINVTTTNIEFGATEDDKEDSIAEIGPENILVSIPFLQENTICMSRTLKAIIHANKVNRENPNDLVYLVCFDDKMANHTIFETFNDNFIVVYAGRMSSLTELNNIALRILRAVNL